MDKDWDIDISPQTLKEYTERHSPKSCARIMSILGKKQPFYQAIRSEIGQELLKDVIYRLELLLEKIIEDDPNKKITNQEKTEYRVLKKIAETWSLRIQKYLDKVDKLKRG